MSMTKKIEVITRLGAVPNLGPSRTRKLFSQLQKQDTRLEFLNEFGHADLLALGLNDEQAAVFIEVDAIESAERLVDSGVGIVTSLDADAPTRLGDARLSPWFFYYGDLRVLDSEMVGFSGSRDASPEALEATDQVASAAVKEGWVVVSGGARGVDMTAHTSALNHGGSTVVVLPQGLQTWRMPEELSSPSTLVLSEFLPSDDWGSFRAMQRNKSIIHLSDRLVIPQAGERGGTMNAGEYALKQKHPTWVVDLGPEYRGNSTLISRGAIPLHWNRDPKTLDALLMPAGSDEPTQSSLF